MRQIKKGQQYITMIKLIYILLKLYRFMLSESKNSYKQSWQVENMYNNYQTQTVKQLEKEMNEQNNISKNSHVQQNQLIYGSAPETNIQSYGHQDIQKSCLKLSKQKELPGNSLSQNCLQILFPEKQKSLQQQQNIIIQKASTFTYPIKIYHPLQLQDEKEDAHSTNRKNKKNQIPNIINQMISMLTNSSKFQREISSLLRKFGHRDQTKRFYVYMGLIKKSDTSRQLKFLQKIFFTLDANDDIYPLEDQKIYLKIARIAIRRFLDIEANIIVLRSKKIKDRVGYLRSVTKLKEAFMTLCFQNGKD